MSQCVPSWDLDDSSIPLHHPCSHAVAELTWQNGEPGLSPKPRAITLESFVNQSSFHFAPKSPGLNDLPPWFDHHGVGAPAVTMDALVPVRDQALEALPVRDQALEAVADEIAGSGESTRVGSCSGATVPGGVVEESESTGTCRRVREEDRTTSFESWEGGSGGEGHTYTSVWSQDNDSSSKDHDSSWHATPQKDNFDEKINRRRKTGKISISAKRTRAASVHSQSERRRRDKINQRIKILQKMVPNSTKTDKASMLDEVIEYMRQLQAQLQMTKMYMSQMVMLQQYLSMSMMGMGVMDLNVASRAIGMPPIIPPPGMPPIFPLNTFMPMVPWNGQGDRLSSPDFFSAFLSNQQQQVGYDAYSKLAALYQQFQQPFAPTK